MPTMPRKRFIVPAALVLALSITPVLTACGGNPIQNIVQNATGGKVDLGGKSLPKDFPSEVPLTKGDVIFGAGIGNDKGKIWNVTIKVSDVNELEAIKGQLKSAGFESQAAGDASGDATTGLFTKDPYGVLVVVSTDDKNGVIANYTVTYTKPGS